MMRVARQPIPDILLLTGDRFQDGRGWFRETYSGRTFAEAGIDVAFVQDNESCSARAGTVRGLHYQLSPFAQAKLMRVLKGAILDVAVDLRIGSPTFGRHVAVRLDAGRDDALFIAAGFAHGFCTLVDDTVVSYKVSALYAPKYERGIRWDDPALGIPWPLAAARAVVSPKDAAWPPLAAVSRAELFTRPSAIGFARNVSGVVAS
ncbi:MAG: dTDP-4-dehydrorhamnose 3,5-epimerase [Alphaproteobacteria bacterium]|nr:dTDP-4-dehydrorhamnose 3,5-epimerase [Alphaproteobacteria bacterium]MDE2514044.1 dTDP-4-dehydrorhamnose 3,5-epimerase [Alphaproteobacteria bacterium]